MPTSNTMYTVRLSDGRTQQWTPEMYEKAKDNLFGKYADAEVVRTQVYDPAQGYGEGDAFTVRLKDGRAQVWDADQIAKGYDKLMAKYPDAEVSRHTNASDEYWRPKADEARRVLDLFNKENGGFIDDYEETQRNHTLAASSQGWYPGFDENQAKLTDNADRYKEMINLRDKYREAYFTNPYVAKKRKADAESATSLRDAYRKRSAEAETPEERKHWDRAAKLMDDARKTFEAPSNYVDDIDGNNGFIKYLRGMRKGAGATATDYDFWSFGVTEIARNLDLRSIAEKVQNATTEQEIDRLLSPGEKAELLAFYNLQNAQSERMGDIAGSYEAGQMATQSIPFMVEFIASQGLANVAGKGLLKASSRAASNTAKKALTAWLGNALMTDRAFGRAASKELAEQYGKQTFKTIANRVAVKPIIQGLWHTPTQLNTFQTISQGLLETDNNGELVSAGKAIWTGVLDSVIENWSESLGGAVEGIAIPEFGGKTQFGRFARWIRSAKGTQILTEAGFNGLLGEMAEEWAGNAVRLGLGLMSGDEFRDFASLEEQLTMAAGFGPMSLLGLGGSVPATIRGAVDYKRLSVKAKDVLTRLGKSEGEIDSLLKTRFDTAEDVANKLAPYLKEITDKARAEGATAQDEADYKVILDLAKNIGLKTTLDEMESIEKAERRGKMDEFIQGNVGGRYWQEGEGGQKSVRIVADPDGKTYFVTGSDGNGMLTAISTEDGSYKYLREDQINPEASETFSQEEYLQREVDAVDKSGEASRMQQDAEKQLAEVRNAAQQRGTIPMDTADGVVEVPIAKITIAGAALAVDENGNPTQVVPWRDVAIKLGMPIEVKTDAELEADLRKELEQTEQRLDTYKGIAPGKEIQYQDEEGNTLTLQFQKAVLDDGTILFYGVDADGNSTYGTEEMVTNLAELTAQEAQDSPYKVDQRVGFREEDGIQHSGVVLREDDGSGRVVIRDENGVVAVVPTENVYEQEAPEEGEKPAADKYTLSDGSVDEDAFLAAEPEEWAKWNDARNGDNGADSQAILSAQMKNLDKEIKKQAKAVDAEASPNKKRVLQKTLAGLTEARNKLASALARYAAPAEQSSQGPSEGPSRDQVETKSEQTPVDPVAELTGGEYHIGDPAIVMMKDRTHALGTIVGVSRSHEGWVSLQIGEKVFSVPARRLIPASEENIAMLQQEQVALDQAQAEAEAQAAADAEQNPTQQAIAEAEAQVDTNPTEAQKEAGNYRKGHVSIDGYDITIENPKGSVRSGVDQNGREWSQEMRYTYGYIRATEGVDGDQIDIFLSDNPTEGKVFVIDQVNPETGEFDEHKVMYGFNSIAEAREAYLANYEPGWQGLGAITEVSKEDFKKWVESSHRKTKPFSEYSAVKNGLTPAQRKAIDFVNGKREEGEKKRTSNKILKRIERWKNAIGDVFEVLNSIEDVNAIEDEGVRRQVLEAIEKGEQVNGFYSPRTGKAYVYTPDFTDVKQIDRAVIHEVLSHKGLRALMGEEKYNEFCDQVWDAMTPEQRAYWLSYNEHLFGSEQYLQRAAADEMIAHAAEADEAIAKMVVPDFWDKVVEFVRNFLNDAVGGDVFTDDADKTWIHDEIVRSLEMYKSEAASRLNAQGVASNGDEVRFSVRYVPSKEQAKGIAEDISKEVGISKKKAAAWVKSETSLAPIILSEQGRPYLDYIGDERYTAIKKNSDYPQGTVDFNNICRKRIAFTDMYQRIQRAFPNTIITGRDLATIRQIMKDHGITVACGLCYVEDRRQLLGEIATDFIAEVQGNFEGYASGGEQKRKNAEKFRALIGDDKKADLSVYDLITLEGSQRLYNEHRGIYEAFQAFNNARGQQAGNLFQGYAEYKREILKWSAKKVKSINDHGGLRIFSYSDFEAHHLIDLVQIIQDCARKGVMIQGYTKVPAFARAIAGTNVKMNRSLIPLGDTGMKDGQLAYDPVEGIDVNDPDFIESNDNVGNILIGVNDEQIRLAMADPFIHYIIPFHSNQSSELRRAKSVGAWTNYKNEQMDKGGEPINIYTDVLAAAEAEGNPIQNERQFTEKFLSVCKERGLTPRFWRFLNTNEQGEYVYTPGYYKLLVDFKLFGEDGRILPQKPVVAEFDDVFNAQILKDYVKDQQSEAEGLDDAVYQEIVETLGLKERNAEAAQDTAIAFVNGVSKKEAMVMRTNMRKKGGKGMTEEAKRRKARFEKEKKELDGLRFSTVFHGSGADFEMFDHSHMGEGEGSQVFGWGTYVTTNIDTGKEYAMNLGGHTDDQERMIARFREELSNPDITEERRAELEAGIAERQKEIDALKGGRHLYTVEIPDDNGENYIHWEEPLTRSQSRKIMNAVRKLADKDAWGDEFEYELQSALGPGTYGHYVEGGLNYFLGDEHDYATGKDPGAERNAKLLNSVGIVGIEIPIDLSGGQRYEGSNYVIFNEDDLVITDHLRFSKVTPKQDAEYLAAIESGDMEKVQEMVNKAAALAMPDTMVVDSDWKPRAVLHGTNAEFNIFDERKSGSATDPGWLGRGFYFYGNNPEYASQYGSRIIRAFLNIENPYFASNEDKKRLAEENSAEASEEFRQQLIDEGYDGVSYNDDLDDEWVAFYPEQIKSAEPITYDDDGNVIPLSKRFNENNPDIRFSIRTKPAPKKTGIGYKVFYRGKDGKLYPPMVANPNGADTPVGVWLDADAAPIARESKTGRSQVKAGGKGTQGGSGTLAYRPGWHLGDIPYAIQFNRLNPETGEKDLFPADFVWAEVEYAMDKDYQKEAEAEGMNANGKFQHSFAGLKRVPEDGYYRYRTNPNPKTDPWIITGSMKVNKVLTNEEVDELVRKAGREPQKRQGEDVRFSFIGKKGAERLAKLENDSAIIDGLNLALELHERGETEGKIKLTTGWELGQDGKWRYELPDVHLADNVKELIKFPKSAKLSDVLVHDAAYDQLIGAYPKMADMDVFTSRLMKDHQLGGYNPETDHIILNESHVNEVENDALRRIFVHEMQHAIQTREGFAIGSGIEGNEDKGDIAKLTKKFNKAHEAYVNAILNDPSIKFMWAAYKGNNLSDEEYKAGAAVVSPAWIRLYHTPISGRTAEMSENARVAALAHERAVRESEKYADKAKANAEAAKALGAEKLRVYRAHTGEVEARNVEARLDMNAERRRRTLAEDTEDVARTEQFVELETYPEWEAQKAEEASVFDEIAEVSPAIAISKANTTQKEVGKIYPSDAELEEVRFSRDLNPIEDLLDRYDNQDGSEEYPWITEAELFDLFEQEVDNTEETQPLFALVDKYHRLQEEDFEEGRRDFAGGEMEDLAERFISELRNYSGLADIRFSLSRNNRKTIESWMNKREDLDENEKASVMQYLDTLGDPKLQLATAKWFIRGKIRIPEDMEKVQQAIDVAGKAKVDPLQYDSPMALLDAHANFKPTAKRINPDEVSTLHRAKEYPEHGIVIYDVDESEESRKNMRQIINTHFGEDASPWCLLQGDGKGNLTGDSAYYWKHYRAYPKQVAFLNGKLLAFSANDEDEVVWWDRQDNSHEGIPMGAMPIVGDELGRSKMFILDEDGDLIPDRDSVWFKGNRENGEYMEWWDNGNIFEVSHYKDGKRDGERRLYDVGGHLMSVYNYKAGGYHGVVVDYYDNGSIRNRAYYKNDRLEGLAETFYRNGNIERARTYKADVLDGPSAHYDMDGHLLHSADYKKGEPDGEIRLYAQDGSERIVEISRYKNGERDGEQVAYFGDGTLRKREHYKNGKQIGQQEYYSNLTGDHLLDYREFYNEDGSYYGEEYHFNGQMRACGNRDKFDDRQGIWKFYDREGKLERLIEFKDDKVVRELPYEGADENIHFSKANGNTDIFISNAQAATEAIPMEKATPEQWIKMLETRGGLKSGEDKWIGLSDWLKASGKKTLSKQEVLDYIAQNQIQIEEVDYYDTSAEGEAKMQEFSEEFQDLMEQGARETGSIFVRDHADWAFQKMVDKYGDDFEMAFDFESDLNGYHLIPQLDFFEEPTEAAQYFLGGQNEINSVRKRYTTEGLDNKREIALTVPTIDPWNEYDKIHFGDAGEGRAVAWIRFGETMTERGQGNAPLEVKYTGAEPADEAHRRAVEGILINWNDNTSVMRHEKREDQFFVAMSMFENALRDNFNEYTEEQQALAEETLAALKDLKPEDFEAIDERGDRVLFIDEIQSKRHQEGREKGYRPAKSEIAPQIDHLGRLYSEMRYEKSQLRERARAIKDDLMAGSSMDEYLHSVINNKELDSINERLAELDRDIVANRAEVEAIRNRYAEAIPAAPFEKNWYELAMKRMLRLAAEEGYDYVAWTTGDQQAERYNIGGVLRKIVKSDDYNINEKTFAVLLNDGNGSQYITTDNEGNVITTIVEDFREKNLSDIFGKELAVRMLTMKEGDTIEGDGLRVGGEGMRGFYDDILPRFMNKYGKKWGVKVEDITLPALEDGDLVAHAIPVTEEMRESVKEGQLMFSKQTTAINQASAGGLGAVIGEENSREFYLDIYKAVPQEIRERILGDIVGAGLNTRKAVEDYISKLALSNDDETGLLNLAGIYLKDYVGDLDSGAVRYILWRGSKGVETSNPLAIAEDMAMRRKMTTKPEEDARFSKDNIEEADRQAEETIDKADMVRSDARKNLRADFAKVAKAMATQKAYDQKVVSAVANLAKSLLKEEGIDDLSRREVNRMLGIIRTSVGRSPKIVKENADAIIEIVISNLLKRERELLVKMTSTTGTKVNPTGVEVQGSLDVRGQHILKAFKAAMKLDVGKTDDDEEANTLYGRKAALQSRLDSKDEAVRNEAEEEDTALSLAIDYKESLIDLLSEEENLEKEKKDLKRDYDDGKISRAQYYEAKSATEEGIRENHIDQVESIRDFRQKFAGVLSRSAEAHRAFLQREKERVEEIHHNANSDLEGRPARKDTKLSFMGRFANNPIARFFLRSLGSFEQMLRLFGRKSIDGRGYLFNRFVTQWNEANDRETKGLAEATKRLEAKLSEIYGKEMSWADLYREELKMPKVNARWFDDGEMRDHELTQGQLLYIYMVNKMSDGRMKLRRMGITQDAVDAIVAQMDPHFIELADWIQDEFLVDLRNKYNAVHERLFGASMAAIDNYFPLVINKNDLNRNEDIAAPDLDALPATTTGSIIKRKRNSKALDLTNADAFAVVIDHIDKMEKWAAFAEFNKDVNTLLSYKKFRNRVRNMVTVYGAGDELWQSFKDAARVAGGAYNPKVLGADKWVTNIAKGVTVAKISGRVFTALKQLLSFPAFVADANPVYLVKNLANAPAAWNWAMENLPGFEKRWSSRIAGDTRLMSTEADFKFWRNSIVSKIAKIGMTPNAFVDAVTISVGAKSIYDTKRAQYIREGFPEDVAERKAKLDATILFNETQQSSEALYLAPQQLDRTVFATALTVFRNSSMGYQRQFHDAIRNLGKHLTKGYKSDSIEFMTKQLIREGLTEEQARKAAESRYNRSFFHDGIRLATFGFLVQFIWNLGDSIIYLLFGDDDDKKHEMLEQAWKKALFGGWVEGLVAGNVVSEMIGKVVNGEKLTDFDPTLLPLMSDLENTVKKLSVDSYAAFNDMVNLIVQMGIGLNPQTIEDVALAVYDAANGDLETAKEAMICILRILQVPQSQVDELFIDEIGVTARRAKGMGYKEIAQRYVDYKFNRGGGLMVGAYDEETEEKRRDAIKKRFDKKLKERQELKKNNK